MKPKTERVAYSVPEMAEALGISRTVCYELVSSGQIPAIRLGKRKLLIPAERLRQWMEENTKVAGATRTPMNVKN